MGGFSLIHWLVMTVAVLLLFGGGRVARVMGEVGEGVRALRNGLSDEADRDQAGSPTAVEPPAGS